MATKNDVKKFVSDLVYTNNTNDIAGDDAQSAMFEIIDETVNQDEYEADIAIIEADIAQNEADIAQNSSDISTINSSLSSIESRVTDLEAEVLSIQAAYDKVKLSSVDTSFTIDALSGFRIWDLRLIIYAATANATIKIGTTEDGDELMRERSVETGVLIPDFENISIEDTIIYVTVNEFTADFIYFKIDDYV